MKMGQLLTAMVTPFDQAGEIDFEVTNTLINHLLDTGTDGLVVAGTTGESPTLTKTEKEILFKFVVDEVKGRVPVIAGTGTNSTRETIELTKIAEEAGVDGIMLVSPYYNKPSQEGLYQHFKAVAESTKLPIMVYNIPGRCSVNIEVETIVRLSKIENIRSVKEASGNIESMAKIIENTADDFYVYSGDDSLTLPLLSVGGHGVVSVSSHIIGNEMREMIEAFKNNDTKKAAKLHRELLPVMKSLFKAPNPVPVKAALEMAGINVGSVRLPLIPLTEEESSMLHEAIKEKLK